MKRDIDKLSKSAIKRLRVQGALKEKDQEEEDARRADKLRKDYLKRTGRKQMKP